MQNSTTRKKGLPQLTVQCLEDEEGEGAQEAEMDCWATTVNAMPLEPSSRGGTHPANKCG